MNAAEMYDITQYAALADSEGIAVAFLDGQDTSSSAGTMTLDPWNVSDNGAAGLRRRRRSRTTAKGGVDFAFMDAVKADIAQDQCLDSAHVFATGFSMGGYFTHHIGCDRTDIRAVAPHSGGTLASLSSCKTGHVPIIIFHGAADPRHRPGLRRSEQHGAIGVSRRRRRSGRRRTAARPRTRPSTRTATGAATASATCTTAARADGQVELCTFTGMGHCWAGGSTAGSGGTSLARRTPSATQLEWDFFKKYAW